MFKMKLSILILIGISCSSLSSHKKETKCRCFKLSNIVPVINKEGNVPVYDTSIITLFICGNKRLYDLEYIADSVVNGKLVKSERRHHYVVFYKDSSNGLDFNDFKRDNMSPVKLDSLFALEWISRNRLFSIFENNITVLNRREVDKKTGDLTEVYTVKDKKGLTKLATTTIYLTKRIEEPLVSLSNELDSIYKMKLYKIKTVTVPRYMPAYHLTISGYQMANELTEIYSFDQDRIFQYFSFLK